MLAFARRRARRLGAAFLLAGGALVAAGATPGVVAPRAAAEPSAHGATLGALGAGTPWPGRPSGPARPSQGVCSTSWLAALTHDGPITMGVVEGATTADLPGRTLRDARRGGDRDSTSSRSLSSAVRAPSQGSGFVWPNDPEFSVGQLNLLDTIKAPGAWGITYGSDSVTAAVISTGIDLDHPDLASKIWRNTGEIPGNGVDDDGNGYVDDVYGWSFPDASNVPDDFPRGARGTMAAGIIGAATNNREGVAGISWGVRLMPLRVLYQDGDVLRGAPDDVTEAICYAADNGARVIFIDGWFSESVLSADQILAMGEAIDYAHTRAGAIVVAPAGDCGGGNPAPWCPPLVGGIEPPIYPAQFGPVLGVQALSVATHEQQPYASHGTWVDLAAPGWGFRTTFLGNTPSSPYRTVTLDLMNNAVSDIAAAHVAGTAALMLTVDPSLSPLQAENILCASANRDIGGPYEAVDGRWWNSGFGCGVVNAEQTLRNSRWVVDVRPNPVFMVTEPDADPAFEVWSPNLNEGMWDLRSSEPWLTILPQSQATGTIARMKVTASMQVLSSQVGGIQSGGVYSTILQACPNPESRGDCTPVELNVHVYDKVHRLYVPALGNR